ncbi:hypothetical protein RJT34_01717 [Clitoria ternatea]|uniref:Uncharacterized protein n=1 Tax=Clitoria ternatea TaxID=43366 RepID=A0AAN9KH03_CLITE
MNITSDVEQTQHESKKHQYLELEETRYESELHQHVELDGTEQHQYMQLEETGYKSELHQHVELKETEQEAEAHNEHEIEVGVHETQQLEVIGVHDLETEHGIMFS